MPLRIVLVQGRRLPMPTAEPPRAIGPGKHVLDWALNTVISAVNYRINTVIFENGR